MSVPTDFLSRFCQSPPIQKPMVYTKQDVIDDFCAYIQKCASESSTSDVYITYMMPHKFMSTFTKLDFFGIIQDILINQMKCTLHKSPVFFQFQMDNMKSKSFYFVKTKISYQYNEEYKQEVYCEFNKPNEFPDGVFIKLYYPKS